MENTIIHWCHSTVNPVMGCDGCELWKPAAAIPAILLDLLPGLTSSPREVVQKLLTQVLASRTMSEVYRERKKIAARLAEEWELNPKARDQIVDVIRRECKCYAGLLGTKRAGNPGNVEAFESPKLFPGRMAAAAKWGAPTAKETAAKPWLAGLPRLVFISDMGDALSKCVSFEYLEREIIENVSSAKGRRHIWLWLTKRPGRMAEFGQWLASRGASWPDNLMAMTTVTAQSKASRIAELRKVPSKFKGLSIEPLFEPVTLDLTGIDWVICGGGSDVLAEPFHVEWALDIHAQCKASGAAFFLKQLGKNPYYNGRRIELEDQHGGDWREWLAEWRVREFPQKFTIK